MALKDKMPDLSSMSEKEMEAWAASLSPDEMMEFMEYLAGRSGATQGLTRDTSDLEMKAIDESKVTIDGPGYVPFGEENKPKPPVPQPPAPAVTKQPAPQPPTVRQPEAPRADPPWDVEQPAARTVRLEEAPPARVSVPPPKPAPVQPSRAEPPKPAPAQPARVEPPAPPQPVQPRRAEPPPVPVQQQPLIPAEPPAPPPPAPAADMGTLAWLESLSSQQEDDLFNLDLSGMTSDAVTGTAPAPDNPINWLEDLSRGVTAPESLDLLDNDIDLGSEKIDPFAAGVDSVSWLDTLSERGGADPDELTTSRRFNIPTTAPDEVEPPAYVPYDYESSAARPRPSDPELPPAVPARSASDFLSSLAGDVGYSESGVRVTQNDPFSMDAIRQAMADGSVTDEQMQYFLAQQEQSAVEEGILIDFGADDGELVPEIPDWLRDMQPTAQDIPAAPTRSLESIFDALPEAPEAVLMPDWLSEGAEGAEAIADIFDDSPTPELMTLDVSASPIEIDLSDPWVEALEAEHISGAPDLAQEPDWYIANTTDPARLAAIDARFGMAEEEVVGVPLAQVSLPVESSLPFGQEQPIPMWIDINAIGLVERAAPPAPAAETPVLLPADSDWLSQIETPEAVPDWLIGSFGEPEPEPEDVFIPPEPVVIAPPPVQPVPPRAPQPVAPARPVEPVQPPALIMDEDVLAVLQGARDLEQAGDIESSLQEYEALIRANRGVDAVVEDLSELVKSYRTVPAVYRVLGDGLMRQGKLQAALNTYREALNQL
jgi:hypothetical protein